MESPLLFGEEQEESIITDSHNNNLTILSSSAEQHHLNEAMTVSHNPLHQQYNHDNDTTHTTSTTIQQRRTATTLYLLTTSLLFADQNLMSPNLSAIASEFGFDNTQRDIKLGGDIAIAFFMVGVPASFVVGCLADGMDRRSVLFLWVILLGEGACFATYFVTTYNQLYWCRAFTGMSVGGALPLIYSVLGDYYEAKDRGWVSGAISMGCGIGISFGQGLAGILGPKFGWRSPFLVISLIAIVCAVCVYLFVPEVERGMSERIMGRRKHHHYHGDGSIDDSDDGRIRVKEDEHNDEEKKLDDGEFELAEGHSDNGSGMFQRQLHSRTTLVASDSPTRGLYVQQLDDETIPSSQDPSSTSSGQLSKRFRDAIHPHVQTTKTLLRCPSVLLGILQGAPGCVPWGIVNTFLNDYLSTDRGLPVEGATLMILLFGLGNFLGTIQGGVGGSYLYAKYGPRYPVLLSGVAAIVGCLPMWGLINYNFVSEEGNYNSNGGDDYFANDGSASVTFGTYFTPGLIAMMAGCMSGITGPIVKSTLQNVTMPQMRGQAFALLNTFDDFGRGLGPAFVAWMIENLGGRTRAFNIGVTGWALCGVLNIMLFFTVERDEEKVMLGMEQLEVDKEESSQYHEHVPENMEIS